MSSAHPDVVGPHDAAILRREEERRTAALADLPDPEDEAEWAQWEAWQTESVTPLQHTHRGCGHPCVSGACASLAGKNDPLCLDCQLSEMSDGEKYRASRKVAS